MKSRLYAVILAVIVLGYVFFFASRFIFHEDRSLLYTELNTTQKLSETVSLTLKKWVYSPKDKAMTVMFSVANNGIEKLDLNWSTTERHTKKFMSIETGTAQSRLSTELSYPFGNMVVVSIANVPASFEEVALTLQLVQSDESKAETSALYSTPMPIRLKRSILSANTPILTTALSTFKLRDPTSRKKSRS